MVNCLLQFTLVLMAFFIDAGAELRVLPVWFLFQPLSHPKRDPPLVRHIRPGGYLWPAKPEGNSRPDDLESFQMGNEAPTIRGCLGHSIGAGLVGGVRRRIPASVPGGRWHQRNKRPQPSELPPGSPHPTASARVTVAPSGAMAPWGGGNPGKKITQGGGRPPQEFLNLHPRTG